MYLVSKEMWNYLHYTDKGLYKQDEAIYMVSVSLEASNCILRAIIRKKSKKKLTTVLVM